MLGTWRSAARERAQGLLRRRGFDLRRLEGLGQNPLADARSLLQEDAPVVFDVGANTGQTIVRVRHFLPHARFHAFEPSPRAYAELYERHRHDARIRLNRLALGSRTEQRELFENVSSDMSSFLPLGAHGWGAIAKTEPVAVHTLDDYCKSSEIARIDLLKIDTQGFEVEVLRGSDRMLASDGIILVLAEVQFAEVFEGGATFCDVQQFLARYGFVPVSIYDVHHIGSRAGWCDALFAPESLT